MNLTRILTAGLLATAACSEPEGLGDPSLDAAKAGGTGPTIQSADPAYGHQGDVGLSITIAGSGFDAGSRASWERNGVTDPRIAVLTTRFVTSSQIVATIAIAPDAQVTSYDIAVVTARGRKGIGTELFEVTTAILIPELAGPGNSTAWGINSAGQVVGHSSSHAFFWAAGTGLDDLGTGQAFDLNAAGTVVVGGDNVGIPRQPIKWSGAPGSWIAQRLSTSCVNGSNGGWARAVTPDGSRAVGTVTFAGAHNTGGRRPVAWDLASGNCTQLGLLPGYDNALAIDITPTGLVVGYALGSAGNRAVVWDVLGTPTALAPVPGEGASTAYGISNDGSIVVGLSRTPVYWLRTGTTWSGAIPLPGCGTSTGGYAADVNSAGFIVGRGCDDGPWFWQVSAGVVTASGRLSGLGPKSTGSAEAVSDATVPGMPWIAGVARDHPVYWIKP